MATLLYNGFKPNDTPFTARLFLFCELALILRTISKPQPPADWRIKISKSEPYYEQYLKKTHSPC